MKQGQALLRLSPHVLFALICLATGSAHANCTNPAATEREYIYNGDYHTYQFCNGTSWIPFGGGGPGSGPMSLISTQTASSSASLQFTNLPTSYNTLFLNCTAIVSSSAGGAALLLQVGEGAGPTWEAASYQYANEYFSANNGALGSNYSTSGSSIALASTSASTATAAISGRIWIDSVSSSSAYKYVNGLFNEYYSSILYNNVDVAEYVGDTNPITGIKILFSTGNITSGQCSLYGMN
jgi:hypothetical protein